MSEKLSTCHPEKTHYALGYCRTCYNKHWRSVGSIALEKCLNHPDRPVYAQGICEACYQKDWRERNPKYKQRAKWRRANDPEYRDRNNANARRRNSVRIASDPEYRGKRNEYARKSRLRKHYDLSIEEFDALLSAQGGICPISGQVPGKTKSESLVVDHCHKTGVVRGLIKCRYNRAIGLFHDDPAFLRAAADYLERSRQK